MSEPTRNSDITQAPDAPEDGHPAEELPTRRSRLRVLLVVLVSVLLVLLLAASWVLGTRSGLRFSLATVEKLAPGLLQVEQADGRVLGDLHIEGLQVTAPGLKVGLDRLDLRWSPLEILTGTLHVSELSLRGLDVATAPSEEEEEKETGPIALPQVVLPLQIELEQVLVEDLGVGALDSEARFRIDRILLSASLLGGELALKQLSVAMPEPLVQASAQGKAELTGNYPLGLELTWSLSQEPSLNLAGKAKIGGDLEALRLEHDLTGSVEARLEALVQGVLNAPRWEGRLGILSVDLPSMQADLPDFDLSGELTTSGNPQDARVQGKLTGEAPELPDFGRLVADLDVSLLDKVLNISVLELTEEKSGALLTTRGRLDLSDPAGKLELRGAWEKLRWPLAGEPIVEARQGKIDATGSFDALGYQVSTEVWGRDFPEATLELTGELTGKGSPEATRIQSLHVETLDGTIEGEGRVAWSPELSWELTLTADGVDPGANWPEWGGDLGARILSEGTLEEAGPNLTARIESLEGKLRGYPLSAAALVRMTGGETQIEELRLSSGPSDLRVAGSVGERLDLELGIDSPDLGSLLPDAQGSIKASGRVSGTLGAPAVKLGLTADSIALAGNSIRSLRGSADVDLAQGGPIAIDLTGQGLVAGAMAFDSLRLVGDGDMGSHRLSAQITGEPLALDLKATGGLSGDNSYAGQLQTLELRSQEFANWRLQKAAPVTLDGAKISAGPFCIREEAGSGGCARFEQTEAGSWTASLDLDRLAFALLEDFVPDGFALDGEAQAKADFRMTGGATGGVLTGNASVQIPSGALGAARGNKRPELLDFSSASLGVDVDAKGLRAKLAVPLAKLGSLSADVALPGWRLDDPARPDQAIAGGVKARFDDLGVVSDFVPDITSLSGNIDADIKLAGTLSGPDIGGFVRLADGGLEVPFIGLKIEDLALNADGGRDRVEYSGGFSAGEGRLEISGQTLLAAAEPVTRIAAKGEKLTLADSKEYFFLADTDLQVEVQPTGARLTGTVTVPEARINPRQIPEGTVSASPDVVIASEVRSEPSRYATSIDLRLVLGKQVRVKAFGLEGNVEGSLAVLQAPGEEILGDGELKIVDGTYRISTGKVLSAAVGKPLTIEQGILTYAKSPINNPFLLLTAQREGGDITAGLRVFGTIKRPKMTFFSASDPGMTQSEITTYLVTGIPPKRGAEQEQLGLSVGTYVAPKLFVEYENSLGDESDKVKLRYDLNDWIELQTETGDSQGGDVFFKLER